MDYKFLFDGLFKAQVNNYLIDNHKEVIENVFTLKDESSAYMSTRYMDRIMARFKPGLLEADTGTRYRGRQITYKTSAYKYINANYNKEIDVDKLEKKRMCLILAELQQSIRPTKQEKNRAKEIIAKNIPRSEWLPHKTESPIAMLADLKKDFGEYQDLDLLNEKDEQETEKENPEELQEIIYGDDDPSLNIMDTYVTPVKKKKVPVAPVLPPPVGKKPRVGLVNVQESVSWTKDSDQEQSFMKYLQPVKVVPRLILIFYRSKSISYIPMQSAQSPAAVNPAPVSSGCKSSAETTINPTPSNAGPVSPGPIQAAKLYDLMKDRPQLSVNVRRNPLQVNTSSNIICPVLLTPPPTPLPDEPAIKRAKLYNLIKGRPQLSIDGLTPPPISTPPPLPTKKAKRSNNVPKAKLCNNVPQVEGKTVKMIQVIYYSDVDSD